MTSYEKVEALLSFWRALSELLGVTPHASFPANAIKDRLEENPDSSDEDWATWRIEDCSEKFWENAISKMVPTELFDPERTEINSGDSRVFLSGRMSYKEWGAFRDEDFDWLMRDYVP